MMSQSWMGSDFSNNDLAKSDSIIDEYDHTIESTKITDGHTVYIIKSIPKPDAPVVWGMQKLKIRDDYIFLEEGFYDEDLVLVKTMSGTQIEMLGDKLFPKIWTMQKVDTTDEYTQLKYLELEFLDELSDDVFTQQKLKNPPR